MSLLRAGLLATLVAALVGCSSSAATGSTTSSSSGGTTGRGDAGPSCVTRSTACSVQADCGESRGSIQIYACQAGHCAVQAQLDAQCSPAEPLVTIQANLDPSITGSNIRSIEVRALYPFRVDGSPVACADITHRPDLPDGGSPLDADASLQLQNEGGYPARNGQSANSFSFPLTLVGQTRPLVLVQAYSAGQSATGQAAGLRLAEGCTEGVTAAKTNQVIDVGLSAP